MSTKKAITNKRLPKSFDPFVDGALSALGFDPDAIGQFLVRHKKGSKIAAYTLSLTRVVLGELAIQSYDKAKKKRDSKKMGIAALAFGFILATDFMDGYIARKAKIAGGRLGKSLDAACDVYLRMRIMSSTIMKNPDSIDKVRGVGELLLATQAVPDVAKRKYKSSILGKYKASTDAAAITAKMLGQIAVSRGKDKKTTAKFLDILDKTARIASVGLVFADGISRKRKK